MFQKQKYQKTFAVLLLGSFLFGGLTIMSQARLYAQPKAALSLKSEPAQALNINTATLEELKRINGIGPAIANRIITYRNQNGNFKNPEELAQVRGIGGSRLQKIKRQITV